MKYYLIYKKDNCFQFSLWNEKGKKSIKYIDISFCQIDEKYFSIYCKILVANYVSLKRR